VADGPAGDLPASRHGIELDRKGALITAFGANPDGAGTLLRLWEQTGQSGPCRIRLPDGLEASTVQPVNLRGETEGKALPVRGGSFKTELKAFAPASFRIEN
jgi:hypothetical protein